MVLDAMFATKANQDVVQESDSHRYIMATGRRQLCSAVSMDGKITALPSRHVRNIQDGDDAGCSKG